MSRHHHHSKDYLLVFDLAFIVLLSLQGQTRLAPVMIGALLIIPAMVGNMIGAAIFRPDKEKIYRAMGYLIIITTALIGLPLWD